VPYAPRRSSPRPGGRTTTPTIPLVLGSLVLAIPLIAVAGNFGGAAGVIFVCIAIVVVNLLWTIRR
jgi:hypothetical protein